ncbi:MAG: FAD-dependent oxidoreductase [Nanoarchaeota archaeon]|nr:FAD-dependent oxidoreductase [Nanoarchaeota archaeon]MBU4492848.1 FAD-dependent oxidoreductase [Nanoarchaeota archaeon]
MPNTKEEIIFEPRNNYNHEPNESILYDVIIIGTGVAGLASGMYAARLGLKTLVIGEVPGGTIALTGTVENYPGFVSIDGQKLAQLIENHAMDYDVDILTDIVEKISVKKSEKEIFTVHLEKKAFNSKTIIFATGTKVKKLGVPGEKEFFGKGVYYCALCDANHVKNKIIAVIGGGDSAVKEANLLTGYAKKIYIINNEEELHPEFSNSKKLQENIQKNKIEVINSIEVKEIKGKDSVEKVVFNKPYKGSTELKLEGVFIYIGLTPLSKLADDIKVNLNAKGEVIINQRSETNIPGFYAIGDVTNTEWKQAIIGVSQGVTAAYYAHEYINKYF